MELFLTALSGLAWTIVYIASIRIGFKQQTYAMPIAALSLNFAWEWIYSIHDLVNDRGPQAYINPVWAPAGCEGHVAKRCSREGARRKSQGVSIGENP
jgi:hypothetical protein